MENNYIVKIYNKSIYKEIQLSYDKGIHRVGLEKGCDTRFYKDSFFEMFELLFQYKNDKWSVFCSENVYIDTGAAAKVMTKSLSHGDVFSVRYRKSESELFKIEFLLDFDSEKKDYSRQIEISSVSSFSIGTLSNANIILKSPYVVNDYIEIVNKTKYLILEIKKSTYGVYHNGTIAKSGEIIKNGDFFSVGNFSFYYKNGLLFSDKKAIVNSLKFRDDALQGIYPKFNRNTRIKRVVDDEKIEILDPPEKPQKQKTNLLTRLLPSVVMIVFGVAMMKSSPFMLISSGLGIVTAILGIIESKKDFKANSVDRIERYNQYIEKKKQEIERFRDEEKEMLGEIYIDQPEELKKLHNFSSELFERKSSDEDFLTVRLGTGNREAIKKIEYKKQEKLDVEDDLQLIPEQLCKEYKMIHNGPIVCDFKQSNAVGVFGDELNRSELFKNMIIDICARQYQSDVKLFFVVENKNKDKVHWLRMLPHVYNDAIDIRNIVYDDDSKSVIFEYLYKELTLRQEKKSFENRLIVFLYDEYGFKNHPVSKFIDNAKDLGVTFVFFGEAKSNIPQGCDYLIEIKDSQSATLIDTEDISQSADFTYSSISNAQANAIVNLLAPVFTEEISLEGTLTKNISLFSLLNIIAVDDIDLANRWRSSMVYDSMAAPIGVSKNGIISLDLHDKAHGPHGLVAGTTGSGKSEILQTYILSMATLYHPYEVGFVIIDFKGGGMVNQFKSLPHLMGAITNIDGKEIDRSLKSIKAELQKRQRYFAEADVNHIDKYIKKYKNGEVGEPLPHLILIVDEFAELKAEQPEFMKELISAARIGRSLGVHLILATQKPSGQVNEQIWSNSRFKLCLKVQDQQDSNEVLKSPLAAEIKEPGRAYLQVGNNEIFELFQSAYSGAPEKADNNNVKEFKICEIDDAGRKKVVFEQKRKKADGETFTQLDAVVKYISEYCEKSNIYKLPDICLPSLKNVINFPAKDKLFPKDYSVTTEIGIYDDPDNQYQGTYAIDLANQNVMIIGSAQSGKTNILQNMIRSIATKYSPDEVSIYIIDFASMILKNFESLNHVGGVVTPSEDEKLKNLMKLLFTEIETRREKLMSVGVSSFGAYKDAGMTDLPQIIMMIDNLTALKELYFEDDDDLLRLCREGLSVGISIVIANSQTSGIGYKYLANFSSKIALFCNDSSEYNSLFEHCRQTIDDICGRCIVEIDKEHYECQAYLAFEGEKEIERVNNISIFISNTNTSCSNSKAINIPVIPEILTRDILSQDFNTSNDNNELIIGLNYSNVMPVSINYLKQELIAISGNDDSGKNKFCDYMAKVFCDLNSKIFVIDDYSGAFENLSSVCDSCLYTKKIEDLDEMFAEYQLEIEKRYADREIHGNAYIKAIPPLIFIINNNDAVSYINDDKDLLQIFKGILKKYKGLKSLLVFASIENTPIQYNSPEVLRAIKDTNQFIIFESINSIKVFDCPVSLVKKYKAPISSNDAFFLSGNELKKLKTVTLK